MIQRIQSLYLLLTSVLSLLFLNGTYLTFFDNSGSVYRVIINGLLKLTGNSGTEKAGEYWIVSVLAVAIPLFSFIIIFFFKNRVLQLRLTRILIFLIAVFITASLACSFIIISRYNAEFGSWYKLMIPVSQLILSVLAFKGIKKDDELVKSYDRVR